MQLGALKNRIVRGALMGEMNGQLAPWTSPDGTAMSIAATAPEFGWSDLSYSLVPNGSFLDYAAANPYKGPGGDRRVGSEKQGWVTALFNGGAATGFYSTADPRYDVAGIKALLDTGGPYDDVPALQTALAEISQFHSVYGIDNSVAPAPALISQGWNDDLFPVSEALRYYNSTREKYPTAPLNLWAFDWGHNPRGPSGAVNPDNATALFASEGLWMDFYVKGAGAAPERAAGGVTLIASGCSSPATNATLTSGAAVQRESWSAVAKGEVALTSAGTQTIGASTAPAESFQSFASPIGTTICTTSPSADTANAAVYNVPAAAAAFTVAGSPTVLADVTVQNANDQLAARLYDVDTANNTERLISRTVYRPVGTGERRAVFQLSPQMWKVETGHQLKLELLSADAPYVRNATGQAPVQVKNLTLRVPTLDAPGGAVTAPADEGAAGRLRVRA